MKISKELARAREYETEQSASITDGMRPAYHLSPRTGWLNDPNGFTYYEGQYHLFYQYHPYDSFWGPMHWGHAVSEDMISWEYLPAALAPDQVYDKAGCFSGSAVTLPDGRLLLMYTGCEDDGLDPEGRWKQTQNLAVSEGEEFVKYEGNPVIGENDLPEGGDVREFRDPYLWKQSDGTYRALVANATVPENTATQLSLFRSGDGFHWELDKVLFEDFLRIGIMWECPNFFSVDGTYVLIASPMDMETEEAEGSIRFPKGNNVCYITGSYDEDEEVFRPFRGPEARYASYHPVDCGLDFYAPQVRELPDGRRIMIGWMQDPHMANLHDKSIKVFGQMTVPRELSLRDGRLIQKPARELEAYRCGKVSYTDVSIGTEETQLPGISGRICDLEIEIRPEDCSEFRLRFAKDDRFYTELRWRPDQSVITSDRSKSGQDETITTHRTVSVSCPDGRLKLRILLDRWSSEIFVNDGVQVISLTYYTDPEAQDITFSADGKAVIDVTEYRLDLNQ